MVPVEASAASEAVEDSLAAADKPAEAVAAALDTAVVAAVPDMVAEDILAAEEALASVQDNLLVDSSADNLLVVVAA